LARALHAGGEGGPGPQPLRELVAQYFCTDAPQQRAKLVPLIQQASGGSDQAVVEALRTTMLWPRVPDFEGTFPVELSSGRAVDVAYRLPADYDPAQAHPVLVCLPDHGMAPSGTLARARASLGDVVEGFIWVAPARALGGRFQQAPEAAGDLRRVVLHMRRLFHTDTDRLYVFGYGVGGEAAWMAAVAHGDLVAGAISLASFPRVPFPEQLYPLLLANLRNVPVLSVWRAPATNAPPRSRDALVAGFNRALVVLAERMGVPVTGVELPRDSEGILDPPADSVRALLGRRRAPPGTPVSHWFRYPDQGQADWLRQVAFSGDVWVAEQMSVLAPPPLDRDRVVRDLLRGRQAYLGGRIEKRTITIVTQKCAEIEVLIPWGLAGPDAPVRIVINGRRRFARAIEPDLGALLELAFHDRDFQRFSATRLSFTIHADGSPP
jgi:pimeloyl-ACP methyl ester carboxylesterase